MSYQFNPTWIIIQFMIQTGLVVMFAIFFVPVIHPVIHDVLFDSNAAAQIQTPFLRELVSNLWSWSIIFFIGGIAGNVVWLLRAIQAKQTEVRQY